MFSIKKDRGSLLVLLGLILSILAWFYPMVELVHFGYSPWSEVMTMTTGNLYNLNAWLLYLQIGIPLLGAVFLGPFILLGRFNSLRRFAFAAVVALGFQIFMNLWMVFNGAGIPWQDMLSLFSTGFYLSTLGVLLWFFGSLGLGYPLR